MNKNQSNQTNWSNYWFLLKIIVLIYFQTSPFIFIICYWRKISKFSQLYNIRLHFFRSFLGLFNILSIISQNLVRVVLAVSFRMLYGRAQDFIIIWLLYRVIIVFGFSIRIGNLFCFINFGLFSDIFFAVFIYNRLNYCIGVEIA